jgi:hypothetical protein
MIFGNRISTTGIFFPCSTLSIFAIADKFLHGCNDLLIS